MPNPLFRRDALPASRGCRVVWAWHSLDFEDPLREGMLLLYGLTVEGQHRPAINAPGMTHEFTVYEVDPETPIDFDRCLLDQKQVSPLVPAVVGFQLRAKRTQDAIDRVQDLVNRILRMELPPDVPSEWLPFMRDGVDIAAELVDVGHVVEKSNIERKVGGEQLAIPDEMKNRYRFEKAPSPGVKAAIIGGLVGIGALVTAGAAMAVIGVDPDSFFVNAGAVAENVFKRDLEMPDGKTYAVLLQHDHGKDAHTLKVLTINKAGTSGTEVAAIGELAQLLGGQQVETITDAIHEKEQDVFTREIVMEDGSIDRTTLRKVPNAPRRYEVLRREKIKDATLEQSTKQD